MRDLGVGGTIILKQSLKWGVMMWTGFIWIGAGTNRGRFISKATNQNEEKPGKPRTRREDTHTGF